MINQAQQVLLDAIKASLFGTPFSYPEDTDWDAVINEAKSQAVTGLISPVLPVHDESSDQVTAFYMRLLYEQDKLLKLLEKHHIPCVILKGCAAAVYYPKPYLRAMGDVDLLVPHAQFDDAVRVMEENGYLYWHGKDQNGKLTKGERHISYVRNGIEFELHHHFSSAGFDIDDILEKAFSRRIFKKINGYSIPVFPEIENGLVLLGHINQHLTKDHLGIRQIIDWEMYFYSVMNSENWKQEFTPIAKEIGLFDLAVNVTKMCRKHLGLPDSIELRKHQNPADDETTDRLLENLLNYGNFGSKQPFASEKSGESIRSVMGIIKNKGLYSYFRDNGLQSWKLCEKYPILRPFAFLYGFFRFCIRGIASIIKTGDLKEQLQYVRDTKKMDSDLGIRTKEAGKGKGAKK